MEYAEKLKKILSKNKPGDLLEAAEEATKVADGIIKGKVEFTASRYCISEALRRLSSSSEKLRESMKFLKEAKWDTVADWQIFVREDVYKTREILELLCNTVLAIPEGNNREIEESLYVNIRAAEELKKGVNHEKSSNKFLELSFDFLLHLKNLDTLLGATHYSPVDSEEYSAFSSELSTLNARINRLKESIKFYESSKFKSDWQFFMLEDAAEVVSSINRSYFSAIRVVNNFKAINSKKS